ncbi:MAG: glycosyltransferase [Candidatus Odinarchaeota archaeon]
MSYPPLIIILILLIIFINTLLYFIRDKKYVKPYQIYTDPEHLTLEALNEIPLVNIIVPAWKEGELFRQSLSSILKLNYPKIKVIVNAGGDEETIKIANSFKKYNNFLIIYQKQGGGKIKALNDCLKYISEGIIYMVDADVYFTDEVLIRLLYPLTNLNERVTSNGHRPLKHQENKNFVKYLFINRNLSFRKKFSRYMVEVSGANTCMKFEVVQEIGNFSENRLIPEDLSRGIDIASKGIKIYHLIDSRSLIHSDVPDSIKSFFNQRIRWQQSRLLFSFQSKNKKMFLPSILLFLLSLYLLLFPILIFIHIWFVLIEFYIFFNIYLLRIRRILFFKKTRPEMWSKLKFSFYFKIFFYIFLELIVNIYMMLEIIFSRKKFKARKNF